MTEPLLLEGRALEVSEWDGDPALEPLLLVHEGLGSVGLWRDLPAALAQATGRRTIAYSRFGHGASDPSPWPTDHLGFHRREAARTVPALRRALGLRRPLLLGHSDGASIALIHAAHHPLTGVVAIAPHVFVEPVTLAGIAGTVRRYREGDLRARLGRHHRDPDLVFAGWSEMWLDPAFRHWDLGAELAAIDAPLLLVQGTADPYGTVEQLDRIAAAATGEIDRFEPAAGHSPHEEMPDAVLAAVVAFAARLP